MFVVAIRYCQLEPSYPADTPAAVHASSPATGADATVPQVSRNPAVVALKPIVFFVPLRKLLLDPSCAQNVLPVTEKYAVSSENVSLPLAWVTLTPAPGRFTCVLSKARSSVPPLASQVPVVAVQVNRGVESGGNNEPVVTVQPDPTNVSLEDAQVNAPAEVT